MDTQRLKFYQLEWIKPLHFSPDDNRLHYLNRHLFIFRYLAETRKYENA